MPSNCYWGDGDEDQYLLRIEGDELVAWTASGWREVPDYEDKTLELVGALLMSREAAAAVIETFDGAEGVKWQPMSS